MSIISRLARWINGLNRFVCRHEEGIVCEHRHYDYDRWLAGVHWGQSQADAHWSTKIKGEPPYEVYRATALYPPVDPSLVFVELELLAHPHSGQREGGGW